MIYMAALIGVRIVRLARYWTLNAFRALRWLSNAFGSNMLPASAFSLVLWYEAEERKVVLVGYSISAILK